MKSVLLMVLLTITFVSSSPCFPGGTSDLPCDTCQLSAELQTFLYIYNFSPTSLDQLSGKTVNFIRENSELAAKFFAYPVHVESKQMQVKAGDHEVPVFVFVPEKKYERSDTTLPVVLFIHGGGWTLGSTATYGYVVRKIADAIPAIVVSPDYALAPEHPFPRAVDDCYAVLQWISQHADEYGGDASKLIVAGDSGGGNLATVMALKSKEEKGPKISFQALFYPAVNVSGVPADSAKCFGKGYILTNKAMVTFRSFYLPNPKDWVNPYASPLQAQDLTGMPPALIVTAGCDPLLSEDEAYAKRLSEAGVKVTYHMEPNIFHGYLGFLNRNPIISPLAEKTLEYAASVIRDSLH
jgi:acetyl esterase